MSQRSDTVRQLHKRCRHRETRDLLVEAVRAGVETKFTKNGIILYGENGAISGSHFSSTDLRGLKNLRRELQRKGIYPKGTP